MPMRRSRQRELVLAVVRSTMEHPTAEWVHREARRRLPGISLATVYRNLKQLAAAGAIREIHNGGQIARFDANTGRHYHIRCLGCGRINDLPVSIDVRLEEQAGRAINYRILGHDVEIHGLCPGCDGAGRQSENDSHGAGAPRRSAARRSRHAH
jgi:Fur family ferric uptake transcriptional regulator